MASVPERREVLNRLGIVKGNNDDLFPPAVDTRAKPDEVSIDGSLESFPAEWGFASLLEQALKAVASRNALLILLGVSAVCVLGALFVFRDTGDSGAPTPIASEVSSDAAAAVESPEPTSKKMPPTVAATGAASIKAPGVKTRIPAASASTARQPIITKGAENASREAPTSQDQRLDTRKPLSPETTVAASLPLTDEVASVIDQTLYSKDDEDVRPPRLLSEQLPTPTIGGWITRTNVIEVIVSETGAVEHARFVATPQRMPDTFILSRAKVWKFSPAMKDGRPVRYRLLLSWEVNP
jgi:hypothetical protein